MHPGEIWEITELTEVWPDLGIYNRGKISLDPETRFLIVEVLSGASGDVVRINVWGNIYSIYIRYLKAKLIPEECAQGGLELKVVQPKQEGSINESNTELR